MGSEILFYYIYKYFIIARRERSRHAVRIRWVDEPVAKTVPPLLVLTRVAIEILPQHPGENKFVVNRGLQQLAKGRPASGIESGDIAQGKSLMQLEIAPETHQHNTLPVLG